MYTLLRESLGRAGVPRTKQDGPGAVRRGPSGTVWALGFTSLFTDISSESVSSVLPLYLLVAVGLSPLSFGFIDGLYQGVSAVLSLVGGLAADRWQRYKAVAVAGYGLSLVARFALLLAGGAWGFITGALLLDRLGKGLRTAPRDAMIALTSDPEALGFAFGVHRALDTLGALLGPVLAFAILRQTPNAFDVVFVCSCCAAVIGLGVLVCFVNGRAPVLAAKLAEAASRRHQRAPVRRQTSLRSALSLLHDGRFVLLLAIAAVLSLATISDSFLYLVLQRRLQFSLGLFPLLYVGTSLAYFLLAVPVGMLADRLGTGRVFVGGYTLLLLVYSALLHQSFGAGAVFVYLLLFGAYYAATDGVLSAHASALLPAAQRTTGLALLTTATSLANLAGSVLFGAVWVWGGQRQAVLWFTVGLFISLGLAAFHLLRRPANTRSGGPAVPSEFDHAA